MHFDLVMAGQFPPTRLLPAKHHEARSKAVVSYASLAHALRPAHVLPPSRSAWNGGTTIALLRFFQPLDPLSRLRRVNRSRSISSAVVPQEEPNSSMPPPPTPICHVNLPCSIPVPVNPPCYNPRRTSLCILAAESRDDQLRISASPVSNPASVACQHLPNPLHAYPDPYMIDSHQILHGNLEAVSNKPLQLADFNGRLGLLQYNFAKAT